MFFIREAAREDAAVLSQLGGQTFYETFIPYNTEEDMRQYISKAYAESRIQQNLANPAIYYALCYDEKSPVGYTKLIADVTYEGLTNRSIEMEKIYVLGSYHGSGAGKLLMEDAMNRAKRLNYDTLFLGVWKENEKAVGFYQSFGFEIFATRKFQLGQRWCDDFMMKLDLIT